MVGVLQDVRIVEIAGIGPGPFCAMLLADLGADVIVVERPGDTGKRPVQIYHRGKRSIILDLKADGSRELLLQMLGSADALIEGMRPGTMERLGLGPEVCFAQNSRLVYGRMTGWGQTGPLAHAAGHDANYTALAGALWFASPPGSPPLMPSTMMGDVAGGALYLAIGILAAITHARSGGRGQVVDAAIVDGTAHSMNLLLSMFAATGSPFDRGASLMDAAHWAGRTYRCSDGGWISISPLEPQFYAQFLRLLGLDGDERFVRGHMNSELWEELSAKLTALFQTKSRAEWCALLEGSDACFAPVLSPAEALEHAHVAARQIYSTPDGVLQAAPAPRFADTPSPGIAAVPLRGAARDKILAELGYDPVAIQALAEKGCFGPQTKARKIYGG